MILQYGVHFLIIKFSSQIISQVAQLLSNPPRLPFPDPRQDESQAEARAQLDNARKQEEALEKRGLEGRQTGSLTPRGALTPARSPKFARRHPPGSFLPSFVNISQISSKLSLWNHWRKPALSTSLDCRNPACLVLAHLACLDMEPQTFPGCPFQHMVEATPAANHHHCYHLYPLIMIPLDPLDYSTPRGGGLPSLLTFSTSNTNSPVHMRYKKKL